MVQIIGIRKAMNSNDEEFISLIIQGEIDLVQSKQTENWYATARKASVPCTFDEATAESMVGKSLAGAIQRVETDPYDYTVKDTGETIELHHRYIYQPEHRTVEEEVML